MSSEAIRTAWPPLDRSGILLRAQPRMSISDRAAAVVLGVTSWLSHPVTEQSIVDHWVDGSHSDRGRARARVSAPGGEQACRPEHARSSVELRTDWATCVHPGSAHVST